MNTKPARWKKWSRFLWREWIKPAFWMLLITGALRSALADWNDVPSGSMRPTILEGDRVWVNKLAYDLKLPFTTWRLAQWGDPQRGEVVVFFSPHDEKRLVKRVIGLPGDVLELRQNRLYVNGTPVGYTPLAEKFVNQISARQQPPHQFASEQLARHPHPVMTTPQKEAPRDFGPFTVPAGNYFMMGDSRDNSFDSRYFGVVARARIVGRATAVVLSVDPENHYFPRWPRFFTALP